MLTANPVPMLDLSRMSDEQILAYVPIEVPDRHEFIRERRAGRPVDPAWLRDAVVEHVRFALAKRTMMGNRVQRMTPQECQRVYGVWEEMFKRDYSAFNDLRTLLAHLQTAEGGGMMKNAAAKIALHCRPDLIAKHFGISRL